MSKYTTEVRFICETAAGLTESKGQLNVNEIIELAIPSIFNFDFPIFDAEYKPLLCAKILRHFYTREIGLETVGLWKLKLETRLNEIMPFYNKMYESELLEFNPFYDVNLTKDYELNKEGENSKESESDTDTTISKTGTSTRTDNLTQTTQNSGSSWEFYSDTPQGNIFDFPDEANNQNDMTYLTNATKRTNSNSGTAHNTGTQGVTSSENGSGTNDNQYNETNNFTSLDEYVEHIVGKTSGASYSKLLKEFRETFLNIDMLIINDLEPLFMQLW